jgi:hypothetical protein
MVGPPFVYWIAMNKLVFDLLAFGLSAQTLVARVRILTEIAAHRRESPAYRATPISPEAPPSGSYRQFVRHRTHHRHNFERSPLKQTTTLGGYLHFSGWMRCAQCNGRNLVERPE